MTKKITDILQNSKEMTKIKTMINLNEESKQTGETFILWLLPSCEQQ